MQMADFQMGGGSAVLSRKMISLGEDDPLTFSDSASAQIFAKLHLWFYFYKRINQSAKSLVRGTTGEIRLRPELYCFT